MISRVVAPVSHAPDVIPCFCDFSRVLAALGKPFSASFLPHLALPEMVSRRAIRGSNVARNPHLSPI